MKPATAATGLTVIAIGAILAFAVTTNTSVFNLHIAGYVLMLVGLAGMLIPQRSYAAARRRLITRRSRTWPGGTVTQTETEVPPYVTLNPGSDRAGLPTIPSIPPDRTVGRVMTPSSTESDVVEQLRDE